MRIDINEIFPSVQGEGMFVGTPAIFVRLQGCVNNCSFCDTQYARSGDPLNGVHVSEETETALKTWMEEKAQVHWASLRLDRVWEYILRLHELSHPDPSRRTRLVVITGGEPFLQAEALRALLYEYCKSKDSTNFTVLIETSGTVSPHGNADIRQILTQYVENSGVFLSVSPKGAYALYIKHADQIKILTGAEEFDDQPVDDYILETVRNKKVGTLLFQPIWDCTSQINTDIATRRAVERAKKYGGVVGLQAHKYMGIR